MKIKDLIEELKKYDPETIVNYVDYLDVLPDFYDGLSVEVGEWVKHGELRKLTVRRGTDVPKLNIHQYDFEEYFYDAGYGGISFNEAYKLIDFQVDNMSCVERNIPTWKSSYETGERHRVEFPPCARAQSPKSE